MEEQKTFRLTKEQVVSIPDNINEAINKKSKIKNAIELFGDKTKNKDQMLLVIHFEAKEYRIVGNDIMTYYENNISDRSKLGKFLAEYETLEVGKIIKLERDLKTDFYKIKL